MQNITNHSYQDIPHQFYFHGTVIDHPGKNYSDSSKNVYGTPKPKSKRMSVVNNGFFLIVPAHLSTESNNNNTSNYYQNTFFEFFTAKLEVFVQ